MHTWRRARVTATLMRRWSARKPTWWVVFDLTMLMTTASRSWPWKPSTDRTATAGASDDSCSRSTATCALYGVMTAICSTNTGKAEATATERGAAMAHLIWPQPGLDQCHHMSANHTGLPDIGFAACTLVLGNQHRCLHSTPTLRHSHTILQCKLPARTVFSSISQPAVSIHSITGVVSSVSSTRGKSVSEWFATLGADPSLHKHSTALHHVVHAGWHAAQDTLVVIHGMRAPVRDQVIHTVLCRQHAHRDFAKLRALVNPAQRRR